MFLFHPIPVSCFVIYLMAAQFVGGQEAVESIEFRRGKTIRNCFDVKESLAMCRTLNYFEFKTEFGTSEARRILIQDLEKQLIQIQRIYKRSRFVVFGSFVNQPSNPAPSDIDLIVSYGLNEGDFYLGPPRRTSAESIDLNRLDLVHSDKPIPSMKQMIEIFNTNNEKKGFSLEYESCVELDFVESSDST